VKYEKRETSAPTISSTDVESNPKDLLDDTATQQNTDVSANKVTNNIPIDQFDCRKIDFEAQELISGSDNSHLYAIVGFVIVFYFGDKGKQKNIAGGRHFLHQSYRIICTRNKPLIS
jgi:hypothetical protein